MTVTAGASNGAGLFNWTPTGVGTFPVTLTVNDNGEPNLTDTQTFDIVVNPVTCPRLDIIEDQSVVELDTLALTLRRVMNVLPARLPSALDDASVALGMFVDAGTGAFTWTPSESQAPDSYVVVASITDGDSTSTQSFVINALEENLAPVLTLRDTANLNDISEIRIVRSDVTQPFETVTFWQQPSIQIHWLQPLSLLIH